jgi:hypothetical protein
MIKQRICTAALAAVLAVGALTFGTAKPAEARDRYRYDRGYGYGSDRGLAYGLGAITGYGLAEGDVPLILGGALGAIILEDGRRDYRYRDHDRYYDRYDRYDRGYRGRDYDRYDRYDRHDRYDRYDRYDRGYHRY